jgi:hypothetical protein
MNDDQYYPVEVTITQTIKFKYRVALTDMQNKEMTDEDIKASAVHEISLMSYNQVAEFLDIDNVSQSLEINRMSPITREELAKDFVPSNSALENLKNSWSK